MKPQPGDGFAWIDAAEGPALVCRPLEPIARHLFTTRQWALGSAIGTDADRGEAWRRLAAACGAPPRRLARLHQVHGASVVVARRGQASAAAGGLPQADIIIADDPDLVLAVQAADCVPLLLGDSRSGAVAAAHAGWRGLAARVPSVAVRAMADAFGTRPADLIAAIGPSISAARYEVGEDVRTRFRESGFSGKQIAAWFPAETRAAHHLFDGWQSARDQIADAGVPATQIHVASLCTATHADLFCSYRRDGARAGRLAAAIGAT